MPNKRRAALVLNNAVAEATPPVAPATNAAVAEQHYQEVVTNVAPTKATTRYTTLNGTKYTVVPVVMITEGVHAGSDGPVNYPPHELAKTPAVWNHKPIVVYHPNGTTACDPAVLETSKIGMIMNTRYEYRTAKGPGRLVGEAWLEAARLPLVDTRVEDAVKNLSVMEVSTGLYMDFLTKNGQVDGKQFEVEGTNFRPDHLAVLPDQKGACSVADGAGLMRNAAMSHDEVREQLHKEIRGKAGNNGNSTENRPWVQDVYDTFCIYSQNGRMYKQGYGVKDNKVGLQGTAQEVTRRQTYTTLDGKVLNTGATAMDKAQTINHLITNKVNGWSENDRVLLEGMNDEQVKRLVPVANTQTPAPTPGTPGTGGGSTTQPGNPNPAPSAPATPPTQPAPQTQNAAPVVPQTVEQYVANAPPGVREMISHGLAAVASERSRHIAVITANKANAFTPEALAAKDVNELKALALLAGGTAPAAQPQGTPLYNFAGLGDAANSAPALPDQVLTAPTINWGKMELVDAK
jgi:hypothetical protein